MRALGCAVLVVCVLGEIFEYQQPLGSPRIALATKIAEFSPSEDRLVAATLLFDGHDDVEVALLANWSQNPGAGVVGYLQKKFLAL